MIKFGIVTGNEDGFANVAFTRSSACGGHCASCKVCDADIYHLKIKNEIGAKIGDRVEVAANSRKILSYTLLLYGVPLLLFIVGSILGVTIFQNQLENFEIYGFLMGVFFFLISFFILKMIDKKIENHNSVDVKIIKII